jgi:hypothetical protein
MCLLASVTKYSTLSFPIWRATYVCAQTMHVCIVSVQQCFKWLVSLLARKYVLMYEMSCLSAKFHTCVVYIKPNS